MKVGIPKEVFPNENRVAATPDTAKRIREKLGFEVLVESGAGLAASFGDAAYAEAGCQIIADGGQLWRDADIILKVRAPQADEVALLESGKTLISFLFPAQHEQLLHSLAERGATVLAMDAVPRISRAQKMDALSSMANIAGYRAVVEAANAFGRFFTGQITAAGKVPPAKVLVIGAGVAGLAAIGAARGLGAIVRAFDVRPEVADQVKSMGAEFLMLDFSGEDSGGTAGGYAKTMSKEFIDAEMALFAAQAKEVDIIITTALIPGKPAPKLITEEMLRSMRPGSVIVDLATEQGGNCAGSVRDEVVQYAGVNIIGHSDLPSRLPSTASQLYGTNLFHVLDDLGGADGFHIDMQDQVIRSMTVVNHGEITWPPPPVAVSAVARPSKPDESIAISKEASSKPASQWASWLAIALSLAALLLIGFSRDSNLITNLTVFVLACVVGWQVIWNVTAALHTPLMSVTNAISGIIIIGGMVQAGMPGEMVALGSPGWIASMLGAAAI
ncbi:MAG: Re/Si-specific NAD(P)(+) transhydrogenase subunit alpha, partial [bacterium]|nr:Re/Si-specific NAD(P)(+) transhydrogenase subunit alpha [bacterium]